MRATLQRSLGVALWLSVTLSACGDDADGGDGGGDHSLPAAEVAALPAALDAAGVGTTFDEFLFGGLRTFAPLTGPDGTFRAVGIQFEYDFTSDGQPLTQSGTMLVAWRGLDPDAGTLEQFVRIAAITGASTFPDPAGGAIPGALNAVYFTASAGRTFIASGRSGTIAGSGFEGVATDCSGTGPSGTIGCSRLDGRLAGSFTLDFADPAAPDWPATDFDVPAVRLALTSELTSPSLAADALRDAIRRALRSPA